MIEPPKTQTAAGAKQPPPLRISRAFPASRALLFMAWTSADHVKRWFSPETYTVTDATVQMGLGGRFDVRMRGPYGAQRLMKGKFVEIIPYGRIAIDLDIFDAELNPLFRTHTAVTFTDDVIGTRMDLAQSFTFVDPAMSAPMVWGASEGWRTALDKLHAELTRIRGGGQGRPVAHRTFQLERIYDAPVARVWEALTDETAKSKWFREPPEQWELMERIMDVRVGGRERLRGRWKNAVVSTFDAAYYDVIPNERLVYAYEMSLDDARISVSLATTELRAEGARTILTLTEQGAFIGGYHDGSSRQYGAGLMLDALGASLTD